MEDNNQVQQKPTFQGKTQCFKGITPSTGLLPAVGQSSPRPEHIPLLYFGRRV